MRNYKKGITKYRNDFYINRHLRKEQRKAHFSDLMDVYRRSPAVNRMNRYIHHGNTTTLEHCENVARVSYNINRTLRLKADEKELVEAAVLHDFFLYDWHIEKASGRPHGYTHPSIACENAIKYFNIPESEQKAIKSHMWPLNITEVPTNKEAAIICLADKYCAVVETICPSNMKRLIDNTPILKLIPIIK